MNDEDLSAAPPISFPYDVGVKELSELDTLAREVASISGRRDSMAERERLLFQQVAEAKGRVAAKDEIEAGLLELQTLVHERSVGAFETMLTAITDDVIPNPTGARRICLKLDVKRDMPALDIFQMNAEKPEAITSGAMLNVLSTGLRFIVVARSGMRPFLLLDEADCFIENDNTHNYFNVIHQLSRDAGIQVVMITHHAEAVMSFADEFRIYHIDTVDSRDKWPARMPNLVSAGNMWVEPGQEDHIAWLEATDFEAYPQARIEFSPGVTAIVGPNGHCKSGWARAFRAAFQGKCGDEIIRHDARSTKLCFGFNDGRVLEFNRFRKGVKGNFILHSPDSWAAQDLEAVPALHNNPGANAPDWITKELGMGLVDGIDAQLWPQTSPVFMLDQSPSKQASLLSIGRESGYLFAMNELYKDDLAMDKKQIAKDEKEIAANRALMKATEDAPAVLAQIDAVRAQALELNADTAKTLEFKSEIDRLQRYQKALGAIIVERDILSTLPKAPELVPTRDLEQWLDSYQGASTAAGLKPTVDLPPVPAIEQTSELENVLLQHRQAQIASNLAPTVALPEQPEIHRTAELEQWQGQYAQAVAAAGMKPSVPLPTIPEIEMTADLQQVLDAAAAASHYAREVAQLPQVPEAPRLDDTSGLQSWLADFSKAQQEARLPVPETPPTPPNLIDTTELSTLLQQITAAQHTVLESKAQVARVSTRMAEIETLMEKVSEVLGEECPTCKAHIDVDILLGKKEHRHAHVAP